VQTVTVIGAALDLGQDRRGVDMGPSAIRYAGLSARLRELGLEVEDLGNVGTAVAEAIDSGDPKARFLAQVKATCEHVAELVERTARAGSFPLVLGGDHSVALGTLWGLAAVHGPGGVLWVDAHGDLNTPTTTPSGNVHGMVLAAALGVGGSAFASERFPLPAVDPKRTALIGVRSLDRGERELLQEQGLAVYTMTDLDQVGIAVVMREALDHVRGGPFVHLSFDADAVDPKDAPGVGTPVRGGLAYREAHLAMELVSESGLLGSMDVVEVNPILDHENGTAELAVELVASALGARIL
jgi:arginase